MTKTTQQIGTSTYTIINFQSGATLIFNHSSNSIQYNSTHNPSFTIDYEDDEWVTWMNKYGLWK